MSLTKNKAKWLNRQILEIKCQMCFYTNDKCFLKGNIDTKKI